MVFPVFITHATVSRNGHGIHTPTRIALHSTETGDSDSIISNIMSFWKNDGKGLGTQLIVDKKGRFGRYVWDKNIAWGISGANTGTLHLEIVGRASFTRFQWFLRLKQLWAVADAIAYWSKKWDIPIRVDLGHGVFTHAMASEAFGVSDHWDPGPGFPLGFVLRLARRKAGA